MYPTFNENTQEFLAEISPDENITITFTEGSKFRTSADGMRNSMSVTNMTDKNWRVLLGIGE